MTEYIKCVALLGNNNQIHYLNKPNRHGDVIKLLIAQNYSNEYIKNCVQGFLTNNNEFKTRQESYVIAKQANQLLYENDITVFNDDVVLVSEDLW